MTGRLIQKLKLTLLRILINWLGKKKQKTPPHNNGLISGWGIVVCLPHILTAPFSPQLANMNAFRNMQRHHVPTDEIDFSDDAGKPQEDSFTTPAETAGGNGGGIGFLFFLQKINNPLKRSLHLFIVNCPAMLSEVE